MQNFNYHTHTYRCGHADDTLMDEDYVKLFIDNGFKKIAFTDHNPQKNQIDKRSNMRMKYSEKKEYLNSIKSLKEKYKYIIDIETGFEIEYIPGQETELFDLKNEVDKIVLGQHFIYDENNENIKIFRHHNFTDEDLLRYADHIKTAIEKGLPDIIVHPDLYMLARDNFNETEAKVAHIICSTAEEYSIPLEINLTEANMFLIGLKNKIDYPSKEFWEIASTYDIKVLYGVDAHYKNQILNYEQTINLVNKLIGEETIGKLNFIQNEDTINIKKKKTSNF